MFYLIFELQHIILPTENLNAIILNNSRQREGITLPTEQSYLRFKYVTIFKLPWWMS